VKLLTHRRAGQDRAAVLEGDRAHDFPEGTRLVDLIAEPEQLVELAGSARTSRRGGVPVEELDVVAPLRPVAVRDFSVFLQHAEALMARRGVKEVPAEFWERPVFYFSNPWAITGPYDDVPIPPGCEQFDFELELGAVIGRPGRNIRAEDAEHHIAGYVIMNDWSARDIQQNEMPRMFGPVKSKDTATTLGPLLVTPDELASRRSGGSFDIVGRVAINDEPFGEDTFANMAWDFENLIAYASRGATIGTGDLIGSGTCGNGCIAEVWSRKGDHAHPPLRAGDVVAMSIDELGETRNQVVDGDAVHPIAPVRRSGH
jgi:2-keto-4-pentenoate hydratase/2-oxohepta-3-ene-1,7-dioic acid hydratase in catechol pathway